MKGALAACMVAASEAGRLGLRGDVIVAAVADEEAASVGTISVLERLTADAAVVPEFTELEVCVAHKGFVWLEVETRGKAAHGSRPEEGVDAIAKMGKVLVELENLDAALRSSPSHGLLGSGSLHASTVTGGQELSSYPERCLLKMERRTVPGEGAQGAEGEVREILERLAAEDPDFAAEVRTTFVRDPFEVAREEPIVGLVRERAAAGLRGGSPATLVPRAGWTRRCWRRPGYPRRVRPGRVGRARGGRVGGARRPGGTAPRPAVHGGRVLRLTDGEVGT
jgi:acetylornithine deacetylase